MPTGASYVINSGTLNVTGLNIGPNETLTIVVEAVLQTNLKSGTVVLNQAELHGLWSAPIKSDDDLNAPPVANPTRTVIPADGVVYDAVSRKPLGGVTLTMRLASTGADLPTSCFVDPSQQNQVTPAERHLQVRSELQPTRMSSRQRLPYRGLGGALEIRGGAVADHKTGHHHCLFSAGVFR